MSDYVNLFRKLENLAVQNGVSPKEIDGILGRPNCFKNNYNTQKSDFALLREDG